MIPAVRTAVLAAALMSAVLSGGISPASADPDSPVPPAPADPLVLAQLLMPQNFRMPTPDQISPYALAPNTDPGPFARIEAWRGVHALLHGGLGRMPGNDLGQPLPGTAPPPGSNLPPGLEQFYVPAP